MAEFAKYLDGIKAKLGIKSDRQLSFKIGISPAYLANIRIGQIPDDDIVLKIAEIAGDDPEKVLLLAHKSKASEKSRPYWDSLLKKVANMSLIIPLLLILSFNFVDSSSLPRYIM